MGVLIKHPALPLMFETVQYLEEHAPKASPDVTTIAIKVWNEGALYLLAYSTTPTEPTQARYALIEFTRSDPQQVYIWYSGQDIYWKTPRPAHMTVTTKDAMADCEANAAKQPPRLVIFRQSDPQYLDFLVRWAAGAVQNT